MANPHGSAVSWVGASRHTQPNPNVQSRSRSSASSGAKREQHPIRQIDFEELVNQMFLLCNCALLNIFLQLVWSGELQQTRAALCVCTDVLPKEKTSSLCLFLSLLCTLKP